LLTSLAALDAVRHIPIFVLLAMPVIVAALPAAGANPELPWTPKAAALRSAWTLRLRSGQARGGARPHTNGPSRFRPLFNGAVVVLIAVFALVRWVSLARNQDAREAEQFPKNAVAILRATAPSPGDSSFHVFVYYDWGGYAIWKLYPEYRVFVDGRADLYGDDLLRQFETAVQLRTGWRDVLERWKVEAVLVPPSCALAQVLLLDPDWRAAFRDSKAILLLR